MESPVTLRLDPKTRRQIARVARRKGISKSEVIRRALNSWPEFADTSVSPYEQVADLIGVVQGGNPRRSEATGKQFRKILDAKRKRS
jgi:Arc/MetJ-type ribon-helix-helix transcriptional regulator